jgi:hypothetical protein
MSSPIIDSLKAQIMDRVNILKGNPAMADVLKLHVALNHVEDVESTPRTSLAQLFDLEGASQQGEASPAATLVQPGQYFDKTPLDAAKDFLTRRGKSATLDEIIAALKTGSCDPGAREKFGLSLARSTFNFVKLSDDLYDLLSRYPNVMAQRQGGNTKRKAGASAARVEEIMRENAPTSLAKAVAKAEAEENDAPEEIAQ